MHMCMCVCLSVHWICASWWSIANRWRHGVAIWQRFDRKDHAKPGCGDSEADCQVWPCKAMAHHQCTVVLWHCDMLSDSQVLLVKARIPPRSESVKSLLGGSFWNLKGPARAVKPLVWAHVADCDKTTSTEELEPVIAATDPLGRTPTEMAWR